MYWVLALALLLSGCANGLPDINGVIQKDIQESNEKIFVGIPVLFSLEGTAARLDDHWLVTAKHNRLILALEGKDVYYHPYCDIALIRSEGHGLEHAGVVYPHQSVTHVGYPIGLPLSSSKGEYLGDAYVSGWQKCLMSASSAHVMSGMSGGGIYNDKGELVGVTHGFSLGTVSWKDHSYFQPAIFVPLYGVRDWLQRITGTDYFPDVDDHYLEDPRETHIAESSTARRQTIPNS